MNDQRTPSLSREMFEAIMSGGALPGSPGGPQIGPYGFGQATRPMGDASRGMPFGAIPQPPGFARRDQRAPPQYAQPQAVPMQAPSPRSMGATPEEVAWGAQGHPDMPAGWMEALFGGRGFGSPYGYGAGDPRMNGGAGGWDARAGYGNPYAGSER